MTLEQENPCCGDAHKIPRNGGEVGWDKDNPHEFVAEHHNAKESALTGASPAKHQVNLAADPKFAAKLAEMETLLLAEMRRLRDPWRLWNQPADGLTPPPEGPPAGQGKGRKMSK